MTLAGKTIAVTGSCGGLGTAVVDLLRRDGAIVVGLDRPESDDRADHHVSLDLARAESIDRATQRLASAVDGLDGLCNIAGVGPSAPCAQILRVNYLGTRRFTESVAPLLSDGASIVNTASASALDWPERLDACRRLDSLGVDGDVEGHCVSERLEGSSAYRLSKAAVIAWTVATWREWSRRRVRMNAISPGPIETPLLADFLKNLAPPDAPMFELERNATPDDVAPVVAFLCDDASSWIRGVNIPVDGGLSAVVFERRLGL